MQQKGMYGLSWFLGGLGTGLALGIFFAPQSGEESRRMIQKKAQDGKDLVKTTVDQGQKYIKRQGNELLGKANELIDQGKIAVRQQKEQLRAAVEVGKKAYRSSVKEESLRATS
jgi:gas vesicle protein